MVGFFLCTCVRVYLYTCMYLCATLTVLHVWRFVCIGMWKTEVIRNHSNHSSKLLRKGSLIKLRAHHQSLLSQLALGSSVYFPRLELQADHYTQN